MIAYIKGTVEEIFEDSIYLDYNGLGFRIFIPVNFRNSIGYKEELKVYTYMNVKEDSITLYGFPNKSDLEIYKLLLTVSGVGPKAAMNILSFMSGEELRFAVLTADANKISKAPGIGKKTAQKILLELKDKFDFTEAIDETLSEKETALSQDAVSDTVDALVALGYSGSEALKAAKKAAVEIKEEDSGKILKQALKYLF